MFDPGDTVLKETDPFPAFLEVLFTNLVLATIFPSWKGLFFPILLVKKVSLELSLSKLTILLSVTARIFNSGSI